MFPPTAEELANSLTKIRAAYNRNSDPSYAERIDRLNRLKKAIVEYKDRLVEAVSADFDGRAEAETYITELLPTLEGIHYYKKNLRRFMRKSKRHTPLMLFGASTEVQYQPLGVIGIVVPWNFPIFLGLSPLVGAFAAGNRAMIKGSEFAPQTGAVIAEMLSQ